MFRSSTLIFALVTMLFMLMAGSVLAADKKEAPKPLDGKTVFKEHCKVCHLEDSDNGEYTPVTLIQEQWEEFYDELWMETHKDVVCPKDKTKKVTDMFTPEMLKAARKFCVDHAADSEQPMTCG